MDTRISQRDTGRRRVTSLTGLSIGALVCAFFGSPWMFWAVVWSGSRSWMWYCAMDVISLAIIGLAILGIRTSFRLAASEPKGMKSWRPSRSHYWLTTGTEWALVVAAAIWLSHVGRDDLIPQACGVIVGLHFFPLAKIFRVPTYYGTGAAMILGELTSLMLPHGYARNILGCGVVGLTLWATALIILTRIFSADPREDSPIPAVRSA
jgi:hypothetical protein